MKKLHDLSTEERTKVLSFVQNETGAPSVIIILGDSMVPCSTVVAGLGCLGDHSTYIGHRGIAPQFLFSVLLSEAVGAAKQLNMPKEEMMHTLEHMIDDDDLEAHKI